MMQCPRCGFSQPIDKYCASCGLDIESYNARPRSIWYRIWQNPSFYGIVVGTLLICGAFYIFLNQRTLGRQVSSLLRGSFLLSKDASDPNDRARAAQAPEAAVVEEEPLEQAEANVEAPSATPAAVKEPTYSQIEVGFFELSRENVAALNGRVLREDGEWRVLYFEDARTIESLKASARKLAGGREKALENDAVEIDAGDLNPDMQSPFLAVGVDWAKNESLHWALDVQLPVANPSARNVATQGQPPAQTLTTPMQLTTLEGTLPFKPPAALLLIYTPIQRTPQSQTRDSRLAQSPLNVLTSEDFRAGYSDLIVWIKFR